MTLARGKFGLYSMLEDCALHEREPERWPALIREALASMERDGPGAPAQGAPGRRGPRP